MVYKTKFLGVMIDSKLNWKDHVAMVKSKLSKSIAIMRKAKHLLDRRSGMILYFSLFLPYLSCCAQPGQTGLFTQSCCDLVVPWPHTGVSFQVLLPAGGIM